MDRHDDDKRKRSERKAEGDESRRPQTAPPIEREHETYAGVFEEDENRGRERK